MRPLRILDPSGVTTDWVTSCFPDAIVHRFPDEQAPYDAAMFYADLDNSCDPSERLAVLAQHVKRPDGRIYASVKEGASPDGPTAGRRRSWVSVDVADLLRRFGYLEAFGVDDDGYVSGSITPHGKRGEVAVWTGQAIGPWDPMDIVDRGLGGSETAAYRIADMLSDMGYVVTLYGQFRQEGAIKDVILRDWRRFDPTTPRKAVIAFRNAEMFDTPVNAQVKVLWLEDVAGGEGINEKRAEQVTYVCGVSGWHKENIEEVYPWLPAEKVLAARNGITRTYFQDEESESPPERERRLLYTSSPDRGLDIVLECWPEILARVPDAELYHTYGPWYDEVAKVSAATAGHRARCRELAGKAGESVHAIGPLGQKDLALLMRSSLVWCHPSYFSLGQVKFTETSCISAMEAQAAGCRVVCANWGALQETVKTGVKLDGDPMSPEWRAEFIDQIVEGLTNPDVIQEAQREGPEAMEGNGWYGVALALERLWQEPVPGEDPFTASVALEPGAAGNPLVVQTA